VSEYILCVAVLIYKYSGTENGGGKVCIY